MSGFARKLSFARKIKILHVNSTIKGILRAKPQTAELFYRMGKTMGEILSGITTTKESITTQTIVITLGFIGLGILMAIGFNALS